MQQDQSKYIEIVYIKNGDYRIDTVEALYDDSRKLYVAHDVVISPEKFQFVEINAFNTVFSNCTFNKAYVIMGVLEDCECSDCRFDSCEILSGSYVKGCTFNSCRLHLENGTTVNRGQINGSWLYGGIDNSLVECSILDSQINDVHATSFNPGGIVHSCDFSDVDAGVSDTFITDVDIEDDFKTRALSSGGDSSPGKVHKFENINDAAAFLVENGAVSSLQNALEVLNNKVVYINWHIIMYFPNDRVLIYTIERQETEDRLDELIPLLSETHAPSAVANMIQWSKTGFLTTITRSVGHEEAYTFVAWTTNSKNSKIVARALKEKYPREIITQEIQNTIDKLDEGVPLSNMLNCADKRENPTQANKDDCGQITSVTGSDEQPQACDELGETGQEDTYMSMSMLIDVVKDEYKKSPESKKENEKKSHGYFTCSMYSRDGTWKCTTSCGSCKKCSCFRTDDEMAYNGCYYGCGIQYMSEYTYNENCAF